MTEPDAPDETTESDHAATTDPSFGRSDATPTTACCATNLDLADLGGESPCFAHLFEESTD